MFPAVLARQQRNAWSCPLHYLLGSISQARDSFRVALFLSMLNTLNVRWLCDMRKKKVGNYSRIRVIALGFHRANEQQHVRRHKRGALHLDSRSIEAAVIGSEDSPFEGSIEDLLDFNARSSMMALKIYD